MLYDWAVTAEDEVELIWKRKMSPSSWLFFANRAIPIVAAVQLAMMSANATVSENRAWSAVRY